MNFETWEPVYEEILSEFGFERRADERARDVCRELLRGHTTLDPARLDVRGCTVAVAGAAPSLEEDLDVARTADRVFAASTAADRLLARGIDVDCMITDLDKNPETVVSLTAADVPVVVHAHGDNVPTLEATIPDVKSESVIPTTQAAPVGPVRNFGGFTDGDRAAFFASHLGADRLTFPGWAFDDPTVSAQKAKKLGWAERLLYWLERRREERFDVLAGRRSAIDTSALPVS